MYFFRYAILSDDEVDTPIICRAFLHNMFINKH